MSRLPGGVFVGAVTLLCGVIFTQFEGVTKDRSTLKDSASVTADDDDSELLNRVKHPVRTQSNVALEPQKRLK
jgi:hypothetical protein